MGTMPTTTMCFLQDSSVMPHPRAGGASAGVRPGLTAGPGDSLPALEPGAERGASLCTPVLDTEHCGDGRCHHWHRDGNAGPAVRAAPQPQLLGLSQCREEPVPGSGHVAHNGPERKPDPASPPLRFSRASRERGRK